VGQALGFWASSYAGPIAQVAGGAAVAINTACSSAAQALGLAALWLARGRIDAAVVIGYDILSPFALAGFAALGALDSAPSRPFAVDRRGLNLGEAVVGFALVADEPASAVPHLIGYGSSCDAFHLTRPDPSGGGLGRAIRSALRSAHVAPTQIAFVSAHATGTPFNDAMEVAAFTDVFGENRPRLHAAKPVLGHTLGAAGGIDALMVCEALKRGRVPPTYAPSPRDPACPVDLAGGPLPPDAVALSTSSGFGGSNAALVFAAPGFAAAEAR
jgi:3-oxoacyl-(acyl-carrier-protein) synthase